MNRDRQEAIYSHIYGQVKNLSRPLVIGINGAYTSGKTVFTEGFAQYLTKQGVKTQTIHYDDFHHPFSSIHWTDDTEIDVFFDSAFDAEKLEATLLRPLKTYGFVDKDVLCVNLGTNQLTNLIHFSIDDTTIVLLEGVLLFRPPLLEYLDYRIFLDVSFDEILRRGRRRDAPKFGEGIMEKYVTRYIPVHKKYLSECEPQKCSDMVVDNNDYGAPSIVSP